MTAPYPDLRYHRAMFDLADARDPDHVYRNYLRTCAMLGIEPVPRERALGLVGAGLAARGSGGAVLDVTGWGAPFGSKSLTGVHEGDSNWRGGVNLRLVTTGSRCLCRSLALLIRRAGSIRTGHLHTGPTLIQR